MADRERVGIVGVGRMGQAMTGHLTTRGYAVVAQDIEPKAVEAAKALGAEVRTTPAEVGRRANSSSSPWVTTTRQPQ